MKITKIGSVVLDYPMWWEEYNNSSGVESEVIKNLDGGVIVFEQAKRISSQTLTIRSLNDGWQGKTTVNSLISLANNSLGQTIVVEDSLGGTFNARFRHEQAGGAVQFKRLVNAKDFLWYDGVIYLAKV